MIQHIKGISKIHLKYFYSNAFFVLYTLSSTTCPILALQVLKTEMSTTVVTTLIPLVLLAGAFPLMVLVWDMISNIKETNTFLVLKRLGMDESALWITTVLFMIPMVAVNGIGGTWILYWWFGSYLTRIDIQVVMVLQLCLCGAMVGIGCLFSSTISSKNIMGFAYIVYMGYTIMISFAHIQPLGFPGYILNATYASVYKVIYGAFFPGALFARAWGQILTFVLANPYNALKPIDFTLVMWKLNPFLYFENEQKQFGVSEKVYVDILKEEPTVYDSILVMCIVIGVHILVTWYLNQTRFGGQEYPLPYSFLFRPSYWTDKMNHDPDTILIKGLSKKYSGAEKKSLDQIDLEFRKGNTYVVLGQNGAGKSTLIGVLTGLVRPTEGTGSILGYGLSQNNARARSKMGICSQDELFIPNMTAFELVQLYCQFKNVDVSKYGGMRQYVTHMLTKVNLHPHIDQNVTEFSGGMQRRMSLILACIGDNRVFFFDEPTAGLDPLSRDQVWKLIEEVKKDNIVFLTTHDMDEADHLSDKVVILDQGKIKAQGNSKDLKAEFGQFYQMELFQILEKTSNDIDVGIQWALASIPGSGVISSTSTSVSLRIPQDQLERLNEFLVLVDLEAYFRWTVKSSTIEDVFLALCTTAREAPDREVEKPLVDYSTYAKSIDALEEEEKKVLEAPRFKWVDDIVKNQFWVLLYHVRFIILNDSVISFTFFLFQFILVIVAVPNALGLFRLNSSIDLTGLAVFVMLVISPRFAMIMHDERIAGCLNLLKIDGMNTKMYWSAQLVGGFTFTLFTQPMALVNFVLFGLKVLDLFMPVFLLLGTFVAVSISFMVSALYKERISTASVLLLLFLFSNISIYHPLACLFPIWGMRYTLYQWNHASDPSHWYYALFTLASSLFFTFLGIAIVEWRHILKHLTKQKTRATSTVSDSTGIQVDHVDDSVLKEYKEATSCSDLASDEAIRFIQIYKKYGSKTVVNNLTLRILQKESFGLLGPNGAGKSTILKMLCEQEWPTSGLLHVTQNTNGGITMGVCQQENVFWEYLTVRGNLEFISQLFGVPENHVEEWVKYVCEVSLITRSMLDKFPIELSGGMKRRLAIGLALAGNPRIVVLDEPTAGVDPKNKRMIWNALDTIRNDPERCLLITSHFMDEVEHLCDRIAIIKTGVLTVVGTKEQLKANYGNQLRLSVLIESLEETSRFSEIATYLEDLIDKKVGMGDQSVRKVGTKYFHHCTFLLQSSDSSVLVQNIDQMVEKFTLLEFSIGETSMEHIFRNVINGTQ